METDYNFWADLLTTYRSNPDWLKFLWLFIPAAMLTMAGTALSRLVRAAGVARPLGVRPGATRVAGGRSKAPSR